MSNRTTTTHHSRQADSADHSHDLHAEAEALLERLGKSNGGEEAKVLAAKVQDALEAGKEKAVKIREYLKAGVHSTEATIKERPWTSVGVAAAAGVGIGLLIGLLSRRGD